MKKIPTLFKRDQKWMATPEVTPGFEWVLHQETYGRCTLPANRDEFCSREYVSSRCPLPGWDYDDVKRGDEVG